jgi:hypothetical protein
MPSFTSNSKWPAKSRHIALLLLSCIALCLLFEGVTRHYFWRVSRIQNRRHTEYLQALRVRPATRSGQVSVLVVGNSLLLEAVNFPELQHSLGPNIVAQRFAVENTYYLDWYYGLRRLFRAGAHPDVIVLSLSPGQLVSDGISGERSARMLVDGRDLFGFAADISADRNLTSSLILDNASEFYGWRADLRGWILGKLFPNLQLLTNRFRDKSVPESSASTIFRMANDRLRKLRQLCLENGAGFVLLVPPAMADTGVDAVRNVAGSSGTRVLVPLAAGSLPLSDFADGLHLNGQGAAKFTPALAADLKDCIDHESWGPASGLVGMPGTRALPQNENATLASAHCR